MPGNVFQNVPFVDLHRVGDLGLERLLGRGIERLQDLASVLRLSQRRGLRQRAIDVVIRMIAQSPQGVEIRPRSPDNGVAGVAQAQPQVYCTR